MFYKFLLILISFLIFISCSENDISTTELAPTSTPLLASTPLPASTPIPASTPLPDIKQVPTVEPIVEVKEEPKDDDFQEGITFYRGIAFKGGIPLKGTKTYEEIKMEYEESQKKRAELAKDDDFQEGITFKRNTPLNNLFIYKRDVGNTKDYEEIMMANEESQKKKAEERESTGTPIMTYEELQKKRAEEQAEELLRAKQRESLVKETFDSLDNPRRTSQYLGWGKFYDVESLRLFATKRVTDQFMLRVAAIYKLMFSKNDLIDDDLQNTFFQTIRDERVFQKILYVDKSGSYDTATNDLISRYPGGGYQHNYHGHLVNRAGIHSEIQFEQREIIWQSLSTMTLSLRLMSDELDGRISNSALRKAYEEAVDKNLFIYNPFIYNPSAEELLKEISQEDIIYEATHSFLVRVICKEWGIRYFDTDEDVRLIVNDKDDLINKLPLSHKLYEEFVEKILNPLDPELVEDILEYNFEPKIY
ncbi:MAG: hypothetical protein EVA32_02505 [Chloroflexi bacterium]|nr:MAG: hypothetical protein EVA32_02505 [Chloroflexota bacterium]